MMRLNDLKTKRLGILGFGQEGQAVADYLLKHGYQPVLFDKNSGLETAQNFARQHSLLTYFGPDYLDHLSQVDLIFRSPGVWRLEPKLVAAEKQGLIITSQAKWFFDHSTAPIIGVTGTKGKGTTASLIAHTLKAAGMNAYLTGNVGQIQPLEILEQLKSTDLVVYELSSFQLQDLQKSPHIGIVLMVTEDHLDVHASLDEYHRAKDAIVAYQTAADTAIINNDFTISREIGAKGQGRKIFFSRKQVPKRGAFAQNNKITVNLEQSRFLTFDLNQSPLRGEHNWDNISAAILACLTLGVPAETIQNALPSFQPLSHRLQQLPDQSGIQFFDDSISTVPDTTIAAINAFSQPTILIIGGSDKGAQPQGLIDAIIHRDQIKAVTAVGDTGPFLAKHLREGGFTKPLLQGASNLREAMKQIKTIAQAGDVVLLSPGYASFDWYQNYKQRGDDFAQLATNWQQL